MTGTYRLTKVEWLECFTLTGIVAGAIFFYVLMVTNAYIDYPNWFWRVILGLFSTPILYASASWNYPVIKFQGLALGLIWYGLITFIILLVVDSLKRHSTKEE